MNVTGFYFGGGGSQTIITANPPVFYEVAFPETSLGANFNSTVTTTQVQKQIVSVGLKDEAIKVEIEE